MSVQRHGVNAFTRTNTPQHLNASTPSPPIQLPATRRCGGRQSGQRNAASTRTRTPQVYACVYVCTCVFAAPIPVALIMQMLHYNIEWTHLCVK